MRIERTEFRRSETLLFEQDHERSDATCSPSSFAIGRIAHFFPAACRCPSRANTSPCDVARRKAGRALMIAAGSPTVVDLFQNLKYEGHPGLWHLLLWVITRFSTDPVWMQVAHIVIALTTWMLIYRYSPFTTITKFCYLGSYFLSWGIFRHQPQLRADGFIGFRLCRATDASSAAFVSALAGIRAARKYCNIWHNLVDDNGSFLFLSVPLARSGVHLWRCHVCKSCWRLQS